MPKCEIEKNLLILSVVFALDKHSHIILSKLNYLESSKMTDFKMYSSFKESETFKIMGYA